MTGDVYIANSNLDIFEFLQIVVRVRLQRYNHPTPWYIGLVRLFKIK